MPIFRKGGSSAYEDDHHEYMQKLEEARKARRPFERDWWLNLSFLSGVPNARWDYENGRIYAPETEDPEPELRINALFSVARIERAKLMKNPPMPEALPVSSDDKDVATARQLNAYYAHLLDRWKFRRKMRDAMTWLIPTGNVFFKWHWPDEEGNSLSIVSPFELYPAPLTKSWPPRWVIHAQFLDVEEAKEMYGSLNHDGDGKGANLDSILQTTNSSLNRMEARILGGFGDERRPVEGVIVYEYWKPPTPRDPKGHYCAFTDAGVITKRDFPYAHRRLPFTHMGHVPRAGTIWHDAVLSIIRPINEEIDRVESQIIYNRNLANGKYYIPPGLELSEDPNADAGQIIYGSGDPTLKPEVLTVQPFPDWVGNESERYKTLMSDIAGQHEVSQAGVPGRVDSAQGIQLLQETEDSVLKEVHESRDDAISEGFYMAAALVKQFGEPRELVNVYDKNGIVETTELLTDNIDLAMRVRVQTTTGLPATIAGKWDRVLNLWQYKVVTDPNWVLEQLDLSPERTDLNPVVDDRKRAHRENELMADGEEGLPLTPDLYDNHEEHRKTHVRFMKGEEFRLLHPRKQKIFEFHLTEHDRLEEILLNRQARLNAIAQGAMQAAPEGGVPAAPDGAAPPPPPATDTGSPAPVA